MYMVMILKTKLEAARADNIVIELTNNDQGLMGMIPVFNTIEDAKKIYPDNQIYAIQEMEKGV